MFSFVFLIGRAVFHLPDGILQQLRHSQQAAACRIQIIVIFRPFPPECDDPRILQDFQMVGHRRAGEIRARLEFSHPQAPCSAILNEHPENKLAGLVSNRAERWAAGLELLSQLIAACWLSN